MGHRVVHGGEKFNKSVIIDNEVIKSFEDISDLAPFITCNIIGIKAAKAELPDVPHCAIMDTACIRQCQRKLTYMPFPMNGIKNTVYEDTVFTDIFSLYSKRAAALLGKDPFNKPYNRTYR